MANKAKRRLYSPRISEDLIPCIYRIAKHQEKPMTQVVDSILRQPVLELAEEISPSEKGGENIGNR